MDTIADFLTKIRNGVAVEKKAIEIPFSRTKQSISKILKEENFILDLKEKKDKRKRKKLILLLKYKDNQPAIRGIRKISKSGQRMYKKSKDIPRLKPKMYIVSTGKGLMTGEKARKSGLGGEVMMEVW